MLNDSFEMMHSSPDLFSQSLSRAKVIRSDTHIYILLQHSWRVNAILGFQNT